MNLTSAPLGLLVPMVTVTTLAVAPHLGAPVQPPASERSDGAAGVPALATLAGAPASELRDVVQRYAEDAAALGRRYDAPYSAERRARLREFNAAWRGRLKEIDFEALGLE